MDELSTTGMKIVVLSILLTFGCFSSFECDGQSGPLPQFDVYPFDRGEVLEYRLYYGWFSIGKASVAIDNDLEWREGKRCYELKVNGGTAGLLNIFASVDDEWGAVISEEDLTPVYTYRNIQEGKFELEEKVYISDDSGKMRVESYKPRKDRRSTNHFDFDPNDEMIC